MGMLDFLYHLSLGGTILLCGVLAWALKSRVPASPGASELIVYLLGTLAGMAGFWLISMPGDMTARIGQRLVECSPLVAALFARFARCDIGGGTDPPNGRIDRDWAMILGGAVTLWSWWAGSGAVIQVGDLPAGVDFSRNGWVMMGCTIGLTLFGQWRLLMTLRGASLARRGKIQVVIAASLWGFGAMSGFLFPALGWVLFPFPVLLLPGYPVLLAYGLLRYQVMEANLWAQRAVAWLLVSVPITVVAMALLAFAVVGDSLQVMATVSPGAWILQFLALSAAYALAETTRRWADRVVYPGAGFDHWEARHWQEKLTQCRDWEELAGTAGQMLSTHLRMPVAVVVSPDEDGTGVTPGASCWLPALRCHRAKGVWRCELVEWDEAPPGPRLAAERFGRLICEAALRIEQTLQAATQARLGERERHLTELGLLAATVAHELRNPLNVIAMAALSSPGATRSEIQRQLRRMEGMISELLDYAKSWQTEPENLTLESALDNALSAFPGLRVERDIPDGVCLYVDPRRFGQLLANLLANAVSALAARPGADPAIRIAACRHEEGIELMICNQGLPIPEVIRDRIFAPFVSRFEGGTGLGLAIVAKIMEAHGGQVELLEQPDWTTCFRLFFPQPQSAEGPGMP